MNTENIDSTGQGKTECLSSVAVARRRVLLKGVGKGAAVLAATVPIQTLASQSVLTTPGLGTQQHQCTISGMHSGVHSATTTTTVCGGFSINHWALLDKSLWPGGPTTFNTIWSDVFGNTGNYPTQKLSAILKNNSGTPEAHWISAWLNARYEESHVGALHFPYTSAQVVDLFKTNPNSDALTFFTTYLENLA